MALTAQALDFLHAAQRMGVSVEPKLIARATEALKRVLRSDYAGYLPLYRYNQQTEALRALAETGAFDEHYAMALFEERVRLDATSLSDLALAMRSRNALFKTNLDQIRSDLWDGVIIKLARGNPVFQGLKRPGTWGGYYLGSDASSVAAVLEALVTLDPSNKQLPLLLDGLLSSARGSRGFGSTHANRRGIQAIAAYLDHAELPAGRATLSISGHGDIKIDNDTKVGRVEYAADAPQSGQLSGAAGGLLVSYRYLPATPGDHARARTEGFVVSRSSTLINSDGTAEAEQPDALGETRSVAVGDILELHARLETNEDRHHVAFVVPFAAGFEPLNPALENASSDAKPSQADSLQPTYVQRLDSEVRYYFNDLPRGNYTFHFRIRAATEGSFVHPPASAELMYHEEVRGRGEGMRIKVTGEHEK